MMVTGQSRYAPGGSPPPSETQASSLLQEHQAGTETILFVEDEESLRLVITSFLTELGYRVLSAANAQEAMDISTGHSAQIDLLLTDVILGRINGPALAQKLLPTRPHLKVIYLSGYDDGILAPQGVLEPGVILLHKPFTIKALSSKVREVLDE